MLRGRALVTLLTAACLVVPASAHAAYTATKSGNTVTMTDDFTGNALQINEAAGFLTHNRFGSDVGFNSNTDFDTTLAGNQTVAANGTATLMINSGDGNDSITINTSNLAATVISAGPGNDQIIGSNNPDTIDAGTGNDTITGARGNDSLVGGDGDDLFLWNDGDGSDTVDGQGGSDLVQVNGDAFQPDQFKVAADGAGSRLDRSNLTTFGIQLSGVEQLELNTNGGDDTVANDGAAPIALAINGGPGNDALQGGPAADVIRGGPGNDSLDGGGGVDALLGEDGDDSIAARDGVNEFVSGGAGNDSATVDLGDMVDGVETLDRPPPPPSEPPSTPPVNNPPPAADTTATNVVLATKTITAARSKKGYTATFTIRCPASEAGGCSGTATLIAALRKGSGASLLQVARKFTLAAGKRTKLLFALPKSVKSLFGKRGLKALLHVTSRDATGNLAEQTIGVTLKKPKATFSLLAAG